MLPVRLDEALRNPSGNMAIDAHGASRTCTKARDQRGASEPEIKKATAASQQLHPDRNTDNPKAAERLPITQAYDLLSDKDKRARYDAARSTKRATPRARSGGLRRYPRRRRPRPSLAAVLKAATPPTSRFVRRLFGAASRRAAGARDRQYGPTAFAALARARRRRRHSLSLKVPLIDARPSPAADHARRRQDIDLKLPKGIEENANPHDGKGEPGAAGRATRSSLSRSRRTLFTHAKMTTSA